jgi:tetratricopeptide (TPR) repeat protein
MPKPPIAEVLERTIEEKGVAAAVSQFRQLKGASPDDYDFGELQLYTLGQLLVEEKRLADALAIAQLWVEVYPKSLTAYLGLGDAYMSGGQKEQAIATYKKALELDPTNSFVAGKLKQAQQ